MARIIRQTGPLHLKKRRDVCLYLCKSIVSQQLSVKVAAVIEQRLTELLPAGMATPDSVLAVPERKLRAIGLSSAKASYLQNVARYFSELSITDATFKRMEDESVIELLTGIKGVGRWTAEMTLIFALGRENVFSTGDYGIQQAMAAAYGLPAENRKRLLASMEEAAIAWAPYRSYACLHLWRYRDSGS